MDLLPVVFPTGWASGVNAYLVVLVLGLADRIGDVGSIPGGYVVLHLLRLVRRGRRRWKGRPVRAWRP